MPKPPIKSLVLAEAKRSGIKLDKRQTAALNQLARGKVARFYKDVLAYHAFLILLGRATRDLPLEDVCEYSLSVFVGGMERPPKPAKVVPGVDRPFHYVRRKTHVVADDLY